DAVGDLGRLLKARQDARRRLESLLAQASALGAHLELIGHALARRPDRLALGAAPGDLDPRREWEVVSGDPLPTVDQLNALVSAIREERARADELDQRLILSGHANLLEQPDEYFR
ncbi:MAG: hypothetical protein AB7I13_15830, partial [Vicinamibacterales bacterium]